ncbi:hypothetical protein H4R21_000695 [Coemansia helicoidea]|uniref:Uncharacterized protein n=1 Tax=Coemansia helicoidea TaxID=1286919 RepID=A0ACC1LE42_9FUNG|nr:hypothetical protein H4R21_000695 [Coemansia helicoidea]
MRAAGLCASVVGRAARACRARAFATTAVSGRLCEQFVKQLRLPGRTTGALSAGVVAYPNDPMVPRGRYFKPKGMPHGTVGPGPSTLRVRTGEFQLLARPWGADEHPRDHNGLRFRDYRVSIIATKKGYSKRAHLRWRIVRLLRTAAALVLPDKGQRRCDYVFHAYQPLQRMDRDELFLAVERALVAVRRMIQRRGPPDRRQQKQQGPAHAAPDDSSAPKTKILSADLGAWRPVHCVSDIAEELADLDGVPPAKRTGPRLGAGGG